MTYGSSPRMRGKHAVLRNTRSNRRIIPAHAGQTLCPDYYHCHCPDHPRACGANIDMSVPIEDMDGSSPRMRGKLDAAERAIGCGRIIPAHAGQTTSGNPLKIADSDHPRACGANLIECLKHNLDTGSSPRMRGKLIAHGIVGERLRIIPAHAGQTLPVGRSHRERPDHPRACGANAGTTGVAAATPGSSPRMRGKRPEDIQSDNLTRIIPAHAGQTEYPMPTSPTEPDHPRACGANTNKRRSIE